MTGAAVAIVVVAVAAFAAAGEQCDAMRRRQFLRLLCRSASQPLASSCAAAAAAVRFARAWSQVSSV